MTGSYMPFTDIGSAVMEMLADTGGIRISDNVKRELKGRFSTMPPYPDVRDALSRLRSAASGYSLSRTTLLRYKRVKCSMLVSLTFSRGSLL